jgi:adenine nucleotide transporter 17
MMSGAPVQPITHAVGGALGSAAALLIFFPLERARIEMQSIAALRPHISGKHHLDNESWLQALPSQSVDSKEWSSTSTVQLLPQSSQSTNNNILSLKDCIHQLWRQNELYSGVASIICTLTISNFVFFYVHALMRKILIADRQGYLRLLASCLAGIVNVLLTNPLWVANLRIVTTHKHDGKTPSLIRQIQEIVEKEGVGALWQGTWTSILLVSNPVIQFYTYGQIKSSILLRRNTGKPIVDVNLAPMQAFLAGAVTKALATLVTYPLQLAQAILRLQGSSDEHGNGTAESYKNTWDCLSKLYKRGGISYLFSGMRAKLLQTVLTAAFTFLTYEQIIEAVHRTKVSLLYSSKNIRAIER